MAQQQLEKEPQQATLRRGYTLGEWVLIVLDLALGALGGFLLTQIVRSPPIGAAPLFIWVLFGGFLLGCFASLLAGICFLVRTRHLASLLQLLGALGGLLILIGTVLGTLQEGIKPWETYAVYGGVALTLIVLSYVGKRLAGSEDN